MNDNSRKCHARFFPHFAPDCIFDRLCGLDESGQSRVPVWREALGAAEEDPLRIAGDNGDDDGGVCAWEGEVGQSGTGGTGGLVGGFALGLSGCIGGWAGALCARVYGNCTAAAGAAEAVARVPVNEGTSLGIYSGCIESS